MLFFSIGRINQKKTDTNVIIYLQTDPNKKITINKTYQIQSNSFGTNITDPLFESVINLFLKYKTLNLTNTLR